MIKTYLPYEPAQQLLLPAALQEWLPDDHLAYFISDVVDQLDMSKVTARYERERRGGPPYHPRMMVKVLLYGYCVGVASSRRIAQRLHEDIAFRVLAANNTPDFRTISDFRKDNVDAFLSSVMYSHVIRWAIAQTSSLPLRIASTWISPEPIGPPELVSQASRASTPCFGSPHESLNPKVTMLVSGTRMFG